MRLDKLLAEKFGSRTKASKYISEKLVLVNGRAVEPSYEFKDGDVIEYIKAEESYVSNGGFKLAKALKDFAFSVSGMAFADIGASTGGFTDCLFQNGAKKVYCIDVGKNQLDGNLLSKNIVVIDNFNARYLTRELFSDNLDGIVIDVSFISLTYILKAVSDVLDDGAHVFALIKPQFECESKSVGKNGIVRSAEMRKKIIYKVLDFATSCNLQPKAITNAPIINGKNYEYVALFEKCPKCENINELLIKSIKL